MELKCCIYYWYYEMVSLEVGGHRQRGGLLSHTRKLGWEHFEVLAVCPCSMMTCLV